MTDWGEVFHTPLSGGGKFYCLACLSDGFGPAVAGWANAKYLP